MDKDIIERYEESTKHAVSDWGKEVYIHYQSTANCSSCAYDPINKEATNASCSTCNGTFFFYTTSSFPVRAIVKTFVGNMKFLDYGLQRYGFEPDVDARMTCLWDDVTLDCDSATSTTYLDKADKVVIDAKNYQIKAIYPVGLEKVNLLTATLEQKK